MPLSEDQVKPTPERDRQGSREWSRMWFIGLIGAMLSTVGGGLTLLLAPYVEAAIRGEVAHPISWTVIGVCLLQQAVQGALMWIKQHPIRMPDDDDGE